MAVKELFRQFQPVQLYIVLFFTVAFFIVEITVSHFTHGQTLLLNAYHMLCNIIALVGCIASIKYSSKKVSKRSVSCSFNEDQTSSISDNEKSSESSSPDSTKQMSSDLRMRNTFGWARIDILTLLVCCVFLASFCFSVLMKAVETLIHIDHLDQMHNPLLVMVVGLSGIVLNGFTYVIIGGYTFSQGQFLHVTKEGNVVLQRNVSDAKIGEEQLTAPTRLSPIIMPRRQVCRDICKDVIGCFIVVITSFLVFLSDAKTAKYIDPIFAIISAILLFILSYPYLKESCMILLQTIPNHINIDDLKLKLLAAFPGIVNVHDFHVWHLAGSKVISTIHIIFLDPMVYANITDQVSEFFVEMGITQVTIQPEFYRANGEQTDCLIRCQGQTCFRSQCCTGEEFLKEIISEKIDTTRENVNKRCVNVKIMNASSEMNLEKNTLQKSGSTRSATALGYKDLKFARFSDHRNSCPESFTVPTYVDDNCPSSTDDEMVGDETPCSTLAF